MVIMGMVVLWKKDSGVKNVTGIDKQLLASDIVAHNGFAWTACAVYASNNDNRRRVVSEPFRKVIYLDLPLLANGDSNVLLAEEDKKDGAKFQLKRGIQKFWECITSYELIDICFSGANYTWCNIQAARRRVWVRLDRVFCNSRWKEH